MERKDQTAIHLSEVYCNLKKPHMTSSKYTAKTYEGAYLVYSIDFIISGETTVDFLANGFQKHRCTFSIVMKSRPRTTDVESSSNE